MFNKVLVERIYQEIGMFKPENLGLINHLTGVSHVAGYLGLLLNKRGLDIDVGLIETASMLHDIGKTVDDTLWGHVAEGVKMLQRRDVDEKIIRLVQKHQIWKGEVTKPLTWEEKLIILGDLSFGTHIVPVQERVRDIISRHIGSEGILPGEEKWIKRLSKEICEDVCQILYPQPFPF